MRSFIAIDLPDDVKDRAILITKKFEGIGVTSVKKDALHITLLFFEDANEQQIKKIKSAMDEIKVGAFEIELKGVSLFDPKRPRVIFIEINNGADKIKKIYKELTKTLPAETREFTPHLTIARVKNPKESAKIVKTTEELGKTDVGTFRAGSIKLIKSTLTADGPLYDLLYEVEL